MRSSLQNRHVLVLNKNWTAVGISTLEHALTLVVNTFEGTDEPKAQVVDTNPENIRTYTWADWAELRVPDGDPGIRGARRTHRTPKVIVLTKFDQLPMQRVQFSRRTVYRRDDHRCFTPDTLVLMADYSLCPICEVNVGDKVLDMNGSVQIVEFVHKHVAAVGDVVSISHRGNGSTLRCTKNHKLIPFSWNGASNIDGKNAEEFTIKDYLAEPFGMHAQEEDMLDLFEYCRDLRFLKEVDNGKKIRHYCGSPINRIVKLNKNFGQLLGYFLSEGNLAPNTVVFTFNINEHQYVEDVQQLLMDVFGLGSKVVDNQEHHTCQVICYNSVLWYVIHKMCYYHGDKRLMSKLYSKSFLEGILYGVVRGDGSFNETQRRCTVQMSRELLVCDLYTVCLMLGHKATLSKTGKRTDGRVYKAVVFNAEAYNKIAEIAEVVVVPYQPESAKTDRKVSGGHLISKVTKIEDVGYKGDVYDLQVSGTHTYVANFVCVHNCQYCGKKFADSELSLDHVVPKSRGGLSVWDNVVLACVACNSRKADVMPKAFITEEKVTGKDGKEKIVKHHWFKVYFNDPKHPSITIRRPRKPKINLFKREVFEKEWRGFLTDEVVSEFYWNVELENDNPE